MKDESIDDTDENLKNEELPEDESLKDEELPDVQNHIPNMVHPIMRAWSGGKSRRYLQYLHKVIANKPNSAAGRRAQRQLVEIQENVGVEDDRVVKDGLFSTVSNDIRNGYVRLEPITEDIVHVTKGSMTSLNVSAHANSLRILGSGAYLEDEKLRIEHYNKTLNQIRYLVQDYICEASIRRPHKPRSNRHPKPCVQGAPLEAAGAPVEASALADSGATIEASSASVEASTTAYVEDASGATFEASGAIVKASGAIVEASGATVEASGVDQASLSLRDAALAVPRRCFQNLRKVISKSPNSTVGRRTQEKLNQIQNVGVEDHKDENLKDEGIDDTDENLKNEEPPEDESLKDEELPDVQNHIPNMEKQKRHMSCSLRQCCQTRPGPMTRLARDPVASPGRRGVSSGGMYLVFDGGAAEWLEKEMEDRKESRAYENL
ncbi:hypothetical protein COLO4_30467 [Corchorus olitorius]|uniref:Uncharacterized protein n=1 Tax=Corchorus olitorius TaxID=93759 RepID=A0A1R3H8D3_9ROSI|nr:hypothetical protein COLO4_30467 [Corchorus olitorius]